MIRTISPSGGLDDTAIQNEINSICSAGGGKLICLDGTWLRGTTVTIPGGGPLIIEGQGSPITTMLGTAPGIRMFDYVNPPGVQNAPRGHFLKGMKFTGQGAAFRFQSSGPISDPSTYLYNVDLDDIELDNLHGWGGEIWRSMATHLNRITVRGGDNGIYIFDPGETQISNWTDEGVGIGLTLDGPGTSDDHMAEGPEISNYTSNGAYFGMMIRNVGFVTGSSMQITSARGAAVLIRGTCRDVHLKGVFGANANAPAIWFDPTTDGQPLGINERITIEGEIYESSFGVLARNVNELDVRGEFTGQNQQDVLLDNVHNSKVHDCTSTSQPGPTSAQANIYETPSCSDNTFRDNTLRFPESVNGARSVATGWKGLAPGT